jgi:hypothetical protein
MPAGLQPGTSPTAAAREAAPFTARRRSRPYTAAGSPEPDISGTTPNDVHDDGSLPVFFPAGGPGVVLRFRVNRTIISTAA